jgi:precorrin-8X/cobalt-precorrin-8 methylmutase
MAQLAPEAIAADSFAFIRQTLQERGYQFDPPTAAVVERVIHSTADFEFADLLRCSPDAIDAGIAALRAGADIICDVQMLRAGISAARLATFGGCTHCFVDHLTVRDRAAAAGTTRSAQAMRLAGEQGLLKDSIVAVGNAPTALYALLRLIEEGARPALVIGVPVGFVGTRESKGALMQQSSVPWIVTDGFKGGSSVAVAIVNALLRLAVAAGNEAL